MRAAHLRRIVALLVAVGVASVAHSQSPVRIPLGPAPSLRPEPVAETQLLMRGLAEPNFNGLGKLLKEPPKEDAAWAFARGQALLIGETANLLMLRPPRSSRDAQNAWLSRAADLREAAGKLATAAAGHDYLKTRGLLVDLANTCNRCHQSFRIAARVAPFAAP